MNRSYSKIRHIQEANQRLEKRILNEQTVSKDRNNPRWVKLFNVLKNIGAPKVLTFKDFDGNLSQSLNWGSAKQKGANFALAINNSNEELALFSDNKELDPKLRQWWADKGYELGRFGKSVKINFDNVNKLASDLQTFLKTFPPVGNV